MEPGGSEGVFGSRRVMRPRVLGFIQGAVAGSGVGVMIEQRAMDERRKGPSSPALDEARLRQQAIGVKLRAMFDEVVNEPVPDEFLDILRKADDKAGDR